MWTAPIASGLCVSSQRSLDQNLAQWLEIERWDGGLVSKISAIGRCFATESQLKLIQTSWMFDNHFECKLQPKTLDCFRIYPMTPSAAFAERLRSALGFGAFIGLQDLGEPTDETIITPLFPEACKFGVIIKDTFSSEMQVVLFNWQQLSCWHSNLGSHWKKILRQIRQFKWLRSIVGHIRCWAVT